MYTNNYSNNQQTGNKQSSPTTYSAYKFNNAESDIDPTCLSFKYWKNNLLVGIYPKKNNGGDIPTFDMDNGITIFLSHTKARILKNEIEMFLKNPTEFKTRGVNSGSCVIYISNGIEYGKNAPVVTICKLSEDNKVVGSFAYEFKRDFHFSIRDYDGKSDNFSRDFNSYQNIEIEQFITLLDEYCKAYTHAVASTVMDQRSYSAKRMEDKINAIAQGLNIELPNGNRRSYNNNSYFNGNGNNQSDESSSYGSGDVGFGSASIDDLE